MLAVLFGTLLCGGDFNPLQFKCTDVMANAHWENKIIVKPYLRQSTCTRKCTCNGKYFLSSLQSGSQFVQELLLSQMGNLLQLDIKTFYTRHKTNKITVQNITKKKKSKNSAKTSEYCRDK